MAKRRSSGKAVVFGFDEDLTEGMDLKDADVPRAIIRTGKRTPLRMANDIDLFTKKVKEDDSWTYLERTALLAALVIKELKGDFSLYGEDVDVAHIKWPDIDLKDLEACEPEIRERCEVLNRLYPEDLRAVKEAYIGVAKLSEADQGNSPAP